MFTGIVEEIGTVASLKTDQEVTLWDGRKGTGTVLVVRCSKVLEGAYIGCSIAVNGVCLTVVAFDKETFTVNLAPETLRKTNLGELHTEDGVNLERALAEGGRNSGHNVQGHVDNAGVVLFREKDGESLKYVIQAPPSLMRYVVPKGYIAVDGTSLTVVDVDRTRSQFSFMLVPHTQQCVVIPRRQVGHRVNLEVDVTAKYIEAQMQAQQQEKQESANQHPSENPGTTTTTRIASTGSGGVAAATESTAKLAAASGTHGDAEMAAIAEQTGAAKLPAGQAQGEHAGRTVHGAGLQVPLTADASKCKVAIVKTCWHAELIDAMVDKCTARLVERGVRKENILVEGVPGSFEVPFTAASLLQKHKDLDAVICIGILLKGGTIHMEVIANAVTPAIMDLQLRTGVPIIFGVLTVLAIEQARERAHSALPESWADSALSMAAHKFAPQQHSA